MKISAIVARSANGVIGKNNEIPWYVPNDLKYFRRMTMGHHVIQGRKNYESIGRPLPKRTNLIVTRQEGYTAEGCITMHSIEDALAYAKKRGEDEVYIVGGGEMYEQTKHLWDMIYLTEIRTTIKKGEVFFPEINEEEWDEVSFVHNKADARNPFDYDFRLLHRKK